MSWAAHRRAIILVIVGAVAATVFVVTAFAVFYRAPSCTDGIKNQDETGIDCGGSCTYLCTAQVAPPVVRFARALADEPGRTDAIAYVDNPNAAAASYAAPYTFSLYDAGNALVAVRSGTIEIPPVSSVPLFIPGLFSGNRSVARAFLTLDADRIPWKRYQDTRVIPNVSTPVVVGATTEPRVTALVGNPSATPLANVLLVVTIFNSAGTAIAASQTVIPFILPQSSATATFTWNVPFSDAPAKVEVVPIVPL